MSYKKNKGFTLLELIVAMLIIAITAVGAFEFYVFSMKSFIMKARLNLQAIDFARQTMEKKYFLTPGELVADGVEKNDNLPSYSGSEATWFAAELKDFHGGTRHYKISPGTNYKIIETWTEWDT